MQIPKDSKWQEALAREVASQNYLDIAWHQMIERMESLTLPDIQGGQKIHHRKKKKKQDRLDTKNDDLEDVCSF